MNPVLNPGVKLSSGPQRFAKTMYRVDLELQLWLYLYDIIDQTKILRQP